MAKYSIQHRTTYHYDFPVTISHHAAHLEPLSNDEQTCDLFDITVVPVSDEVESREDYFGNVMHMFSIQEMHQSFVLETESVVRVHAKAIDLSLQTCSCAEARDYLKSEHPRDILGVIEYCYSTDSTPDFPELREFASEVFKDNKPIGLAVLEMLDVFKNEFEFDPRATEVSTPISEVLKTRRGVCQDYAHLMIAALRSCGFSAKYVSGYILSTPPEGMPRLVGADASHAWVSIFIPQLGWVEVDPTNNLVCNNEHVRVAYARDYSDVSMIKGAVTGGGKHTIKVEVTMTPYEGKRLAATS